MLELLSVRWLWAGAGWVCVLAVTLWLLALLFPTLPPGTRKERAPEEESGRQQESSDDTQPAGSPLAEPPPRKEHP